MDLGVGTSGSQLSQRDLDAADGVANFCIWCEIHSGWQRMQAFTAGRTGSLTAVSVTTFQTGSPDATLRIEVYRLDPAQRPTGTALASVTLAAGAISWAPVALPATVNMAVGVGLRHCGVVSSATTRGCFGLAYNDTPPIPVAVKPTPAVARDSSRRPAGRPSSDRGIAVGHGVGRNHVVTR